MNDTMNSGDDVSSPEAEEKPLTNGHSSDPEADEEAIVAQKIEEDEEAKEAMVEKVGVKSDFSMIEKVNSCINRLLWMDAEVNDEAIVAET